MFFYKYENFSKFEDVLISLNQFKTEDWHKITVKQVEGFIYNNLRLIVEQLNDVKKAQNLQQKLLTLSDKINLQFTNSSAHHLAFEIMGIAQGLFSKSENKVNYTLQLPPEIRLKIYAELASKLKAMFSVSKQESKLSLEAHINWVETENVSLKALGCKSVKHAIMYINNNINLSTINLSEFNDSLADTSWVEFLTRYLFGGIKVLNSTTDKDLESIQDCTWIKKLSISSNSVTDNGLKFLSKMNLQSIDLSGCGNLTDNAFRYLKNMPLKEIRFRIFNEINEQLTDEALKHLKATPLEKIDFSNCNFLSDNGVEHLKEMSLKEVWFGGCDKLTDKSLEYLQGMPLQCVYFCDCNLLTDKAFEYLKGKQLQSISFGGCNLLTNQVFEYLTKMPLQDINFSGCNLLTDSALEYLMEMSLQSVVFSGCDKITDEALETLQKHYNDRGLKLKITH